MKYCLQPSKPQWSLCSPDLSPHCMQLLLGISPHVSNEHLKLNIWKTGLLSFLPEPASSQVFPEVQAMYLEIIPDSFFPLTKLTLSANLVGFTVNIYLEPEHISFSSTHLGSIKVKSLKCPPFPLWLTSSPLGHPPLGCHPPPLAVPCSIPAILISLLHYWQPRCSHLSICTTGPSAEKPPSSRCSLEFPPTLLQLSVHMSPLKETFSLFGIVTHFASFQHFLFSFPTLYFL